MHVPKLGMAILGFSKGELLFVNNSTLKEVFPEPLRIDEIPTGMCLFNDVVIIAASNQSVYFLPANANSQS